MIFFVHLAATLDNWDPRIIDPVAQQHHVIAFDNRGVGASTGTVPNTVESMADDAYAFITALGFDTVDIFSFSLGRMVAQALVMKHPELVRKLILTGTGPAGGEGIDKVARTTYYDTLRATLSRQDPKEFLFFNRDDIGKRAAREFVQRLEERTEDRDKPIAVKAFLTQLKAIKRWGRSTPADLSAITQPTLIANGDNDRMVPSSLSEDMHRRIAGSQLTIYPDSGHGAIFQYHTEFASTAIKFITIDPEPRTHILKPPEGERAGDRALAATKTSQAVRPGLSPVVEPGIEPGSKSPLNCGNAENHDTKRRESMRDDLWIRESC